MFLVKKPKTKGLGRWRNTRLVPDFPRHRPSKDLKGITRFRTVHPQKILSKPAEHNLYNIRILLYPQPNWRYAPSFQSTWKGKRIQSPSVHLRVVLPTAIFKTCYHSKPFFYIRHTNHTPSALSADKNSFEQHKPMFTAPILNSNLNAANLI